MKLGTNTLLYLHYKFDVTLRVIPGNAVIKIYLAHDLARALSSADGDSYGNAQEG